MALKKKKTEKNYVVAVMDHEKTMEGIASGSIYVPHPVKVYSDILNNAKAKISDHKDMRKFIKMTKLNKKEVRHYWESLISNNYTIFYVEYDKESPTIENLFSTNILKFVAKAE